MAKVDLERMFDAVKSIQRAAGRLSVDLSTLELERRERAYTEAIRRGPAGPGDASSEEEGMGQDAP